MKIAVIGGGISGMASAYILSAEHEVVLYEKANQLGGHANTQFVHGKGKDTPVDTGFMVYNPERYPNFLGLIDGLGVESIETSMSFGVYIPNEVTFRGNFPNGIFAKRTNVFSLRYLKFIREIIRFRKVAQITLSESQDTEISLTRYLNENNISDDFAEWFLYPMLSAIWSMKDTQNVGDFPALATLRFLDNHKLLSQLRPKWRTIKGGSIEYVKRLQVELESRGVDIRTNQKIKAVTRGTNEATVQTAQLENYDYVLFATHADITMKLLADITNQEKSALVMFSYSKNSTVLHSDTSVLPDNKNVVAAWNYTSQKKPTQKGAKPIFTYNMNILQHIPAQNPMYVTLNADSKISQKKVHFKKQYEHPEYSLKSIQGQEAIKDLQGVNRTLYAGAHLGFGFHEDGVTSAMQATRALGLEAPWKSL